MKITLADLEERCINIRKDYPDIPNCSVEGCKNPVDGTVGMGWDTTCPYHRLLFDWWLYEVDPENAMHKKTHIRRGKFKSWMKKIGKSRCDQIVLNMSNDPINWAC